MQIRDSFITSYRFIHPHRPGWMTIIRMGKKEGPVASHLTAIIFNYYSVESFETFWVNHFLPPSDILLPSLQVP